MGRRVMSEAIAHEVEHMMESVALPGGGGVKAAVRDYRVAVKTGTAKKIDDSGKYVDKYVAYTAGVAPASDPRWWWSSTILKTAPTTAVPSPRRCSAKLWATCCVWRMCDRMVYRRILTTLSSCVNHGVYNTGE